MRKKQRQRSLGRGAALTVGRAGLALAVIAVVVAGEKRSVDVDRVSDGLAETVTRETHFGIFDEEGLSSLRCCVPVLEECDGSRVSTAKAGKEIEVVLVGGICVLMDILS